MRVRVALTMALLAAALLLSIVARLAVGGVGGGGWPQTEQVWELRGLRVGTGLAVGVGLAVGGVLLQSLLRNPLASPDILGVASGASLAVVLAMAGTAAWLGGEAVGGVGGWQAGPAVVGAMVTLGAVYLLSQRRGLVDPISLVLVGVIVGIMCSAGVMLVQHTMPDRGLGSMRLLVGALSDEVTWRQLAAVGGAVAFAAMLGVVLGPAMDAASLGDDEAHGVGVRLGTLRVVLFAAAGVLTAAAVTLAGPIGFVGLVAPHLVRLMTGMQGGHRALVIGAAMAGAAIVIGADAAVKGIQLGGGRLPIGVLTAVLGGPVFILLLRRERLSGR